MSAPITEVREAAEPGCLDRASQGLGDAKKAIEKFVMNHPVVALVGTIFFSIYCISQILPTILVVALVGIPTYIVAQTIYHNYDQFSQKLVAEFRK